MPHLELPAFTVLETADVAAARFALKAIYGARVFDVKERNKFNVRASFVKSGGISLSYCDYASPVSIGFPEACFVRQHICLSGHAAISVGDETHEINHVNWSGIVPADRPVNYAYGAETKQLVMWIDQHQLMNKVSALLGGESGKPIEFEANGIVQQSAIQSMRRAVEFLATELGSIEHTVSPASCFAELEDFIILRFIYGHNHNLVSRLAQKEGAPSKRQMRRLENYILDNPRDPLDAETIAGVTGVSARSIFRYFKSFHGCTPQAYRKRIRLERARSLLQTTGYGQSVMAVALGLGFQSLGHFARDYRDQFGELPSVTLLRSSRR